MASLLFAALAAEPQAVRRTRVRDDDWPVLSGERLVRFVFGALAGLFAGIELTSRVHVGTVGNVIVVAAAIIGFGLGAAWIGDRFWTGVGR